MSDGNSDAKIATAVDDPSPSPEELDESIKQLIAFRDRLIGDVTGMGRKLKMPQKQVDFTLSQHPELQKIEAVLAQLQLQKAQQT